jgi:hypothetical protein
MDETTIRFIQDLLEERAETQEEVKAIKTDLEETKTQMAMIMAHLNQKKEIIGAGTKTTLPDMVTQAAIPGKNQQQKPAPKSTPKKEKGHPTKNTFVEAAMRPIVNTPVQEVDGKHDGFIIVNHTKRARTLEGVRRQRQTLSEEQMDRMKNGLSRRNREVKEIFVRGWKETESYSIMRNFFEGLGIKSSWLRELTWISKETLQIIVRAEHMDKIQTKVNECEGIFVDEGFDWAKYIQKKNKKSLEETIKGINKQIQRLKGSSRPVRETLKGQRDQVEAYLKNSQKELLEQPTQAPLMGDH